MTPEPERIAVIEPGAPCRIYFGSDAYNATVVHHYCRHAGLDWWSVSLDDQPKQGLHVRSELELWQR